MTISPGTGAPRRPSFILPLFLCSLLIACGGAEPEGNAADDTGDSTPVTALEQTAIWIAGSDGASRVIVDAADPDGSTATAVVSSAVDASSRSRIRGRIAAAPRVPALLSAGSGVRRIGLDRTLAADAVDAETAAELSPDLLTARRDGERVWLGDNEEGGRCDHSRYRVPGPARRRRPAQRTAVADCR